MIRSFEVGVLTITWILDDKPWAPPGRRGMVYPAQITECRTDGETLPRNMINFALVGAVVRDPAGTLCVIYGVESFATMSLGAGARIGVLLEPVE